MTKMNSNILISAGGLEVIEGNEATLVKFYMQNLLSSSVYHGSH